ncbi:nuclear transport factor 2 family protein [Robertkochia solimangrovi]|uniref:nuclear transport factor 2 family protein n=1 Tax=Robertkochia solimangrovi TaxID=2213046 RepID=UPI001180FBF9|nr:nuclear transport factor 2 family protein [Robertkochia solimangrovi]TRZ43627.1 nuclear transport factor 2 family protein [Robertkochia solimangrovi]
MNTEEVAERLVQLCQNGNYHQAYEELYAENAISKEMDGIPNDETHGKKAIIKGYDQWASNIQEFHSGEVGEPLVAGNHFAVPMFYDITFKEGGRHSMEELCVYEVLDGKIVSARFYYDTSGIPKA